MQILKPKYPNKQTINLAAQEIHKAGIKTQLGIFVLFLIFLAVFVKFAVIGRIEAADRAQTLYQETVQQIETLKEKTKDFDEVLKAYRQFDDNFFSESEAAERGRMEIIRLAEDSVQNKADLENINITGNQLTITLDNTSLSAVSEVVAALEADEMTAYVTVSTAGTGRENQQDKTISADIVVQLKNGGEEEQ